MQEEEVHQVVRLHLEGLRAEIDLLNEIITGKSVRENKEELLAKLLLNITKTGEGQIFICVDKGEYVGYCLATKKIYPIEKPSVNGCINGIYVKPEHRRKKVGKLLIDKAEEWLKAEGIEFLELYHMIHDERAGGFWKSRGFVPVQYNCVKKL